MDGDFLKWLKDEVHIGPASDDHLMDAARNSSQIASGETPNARQRSRELSSF